MRGRVAALAFGMALIASAVSVHPLHAQRPAASFLLAPVAPDSSEITLASGRSNPSDYADRPPPPAASLRLSGDSATIPAREVEGRRSSRPVTQPITGNELFDYLDTEPRAASRPREEQPIERKRSERPGWFSRKIEDVFNPDTYAGRFESDHGFDCFVSPLISPFLFEDPRSLTEIRPIFVYNNIPNEQPNFQGGNMWFLGTQARLAITKRFSVTLNKLGATSINPGGTPFLDSNTGFSELWLGPKFAFYRDEDAGTLLAGGAIFQIPVGSGSVYQNTGSLSIAPYVSVGKSFLKSELGSFVGLFNTGYAFATDRARSEYYYLNAHLDWDIGNRHRFFPLAEMSWIQYTRSGTATPFIGEGRDLVNFGSVSDGSGLLTGALGMRIKITSNTEIGGAFELPLAGNRDFMRNRFVVDFIWRY